MSNKLNTSLLILLAIYLILSSYLLYECEGTKNILYGLAMASIINAARSPQFGQKQYPRPMPLPYPMFIPQPRPFRQEVEKEEPPRRPNVNCNYHCKHNQHIYHNEIYELGHNGHGGYGGGGYGGVGYGGGHGGGGGCKKCRKCNQKKKDFDNYGGYVDQSYDGH